MGIIAKISNAKITDTPDYFNGWCNRVRNILLTPADQTVEGTGLNGYTPVMGYGWAKEDVAEISERVFRGMRHTKTRDGRPVTTFRAASLIVAKADWTSRVLAEIARRGANISGYESKVEDFLDDVWFNPPNPPSTTAVQAAAMLIENELVHMPSNSQALPKNHADGTRLDDATKNEQEVPLTEEELAGKRLEREATQVLDTLKLNPKPKVDPDALDPEFEKQLKALGTELRASKDEDEMQDRSVALYEFVVEAFRNNVITEKQKNKLHKQLEAVVFQIGKELEAQSAA